MRANTMLMNPFPNSYLNDPLAGVRAAKKATRSIAGLSVSEYEEVLERVNAMPEEERAQYLADNPHDQYVLDHPEEFGPREPPEGEKPAIVDDDTSEDYVDPDADVDGEDEVDEEAAGAHTA
jgi:hypothetical protein